MLHLAAFLRERYFCTFFSAVRTMLPAGLWFQVKDTYSLTQDRSWQQMNIRQPDAAALLRMLADCGGQADGSVLRRTVTDEEAFEKAIAYLLRKKWITAQQDYLRRASDKTEKIASLAVPAEEAMAYAASRSKAALLQRAVLELMCAVGSAAVKEICYFTGAKPGTVKRLAQLGYLELSEKSLLRCRQIRPAKLDGPLELNREQAKAFEGLSDQMGQQNPGTALLYGVTGSGKTAVYIKLIQKCLAS
jgi:primosomal protein N' (replication factor Y)